MCIDFFYFIYLFIYSKFPQRFVRIMENEEKEDLLLEATESEDEKEEIDYYIEQKILDFIKNEKQSSKCNKKTLLFIMTCFFLFLSSSVLHVVLPIYMKYSSMNSISTYSKLATLSLINAIFFVIAHVIGYFSKCGSHILSYHNLCLGDVIKVSFLLSIGSVSVFLLLEDGYLSCHLKDPLKGCSILFSLLFYFIFSRKKMSLERTFCAITIIVGVFVSVDFGICDKFHCYGNSNLTETTSKFQFLYVVLYLLANGVWTLHFTFIEVCWTIKDSSSNDSVFSKLSSNGNSGIGNLKPLTQSLSIICQEEDQEIQSKKETSPKSRSKKILLDSKCQNDNLRNNEMDVSLSISVLHRNQLSVPDFQKFPLTSTPNNELDKWTSSWTSGHSYDFALWQHITCCLIVLCLCWVPTMSFLNEKPKLLVDVISEILSSIHCHLGFKDYTNCSYLSIISIIVSVSYVVLMLSSIEILKTAQSAITVISIMMAALPVSSFFWSLFRITDNSISVLEFSPEITGEAVCAVLGLPIIGIGIILLLKSHIREFKLGI